MTARRRKKSNRFRAKTTHGWGSKKKHRGAGNRGGRGMAGSGKRADQKKISIIKEYNNQYFGKHGFVRQPKIKRLKAINLGLINQKINLCKKEGNYYVFDASKYEKVLSNGTLTEKFKIIGNSFSKKALEKIKNLGSEAITNVNNEELSDESA